MRRMMAMVALVAAACGSESSPAAAKPSINGSITIKDTYRSAADQPCAGKGGYGDIREGTQVTVKDGAGELLAVGGLAAGRTVDAGRDFDVYSGTFAISHCRLEFFIPDLPDRPFYQVEVSHRGALSYSRDDLAGKGWRVEFVLG